MEFVKNWVVTIAIVAILLIVIEMVLPSGKNKAFIRMFSGIVVIIVIISPIIGVLNGNYDFQEIIFRDNEYMQRIEIVNSSQFIEDEKKSLIIEEYRKKIIEHISYIVGKHEEIRSIEADVIINDDAKSEEFGTIRRIYVNATLKGQKSESGTDRSKQQISESKKMIIKDIKNVMIQKVEIIPINSSGNNSDYSNFDHSRGDVSVGNKNDNPIKVGENDALNVGNNNYIVNAALEKKIAEELGNIFYIDANAIVICFTNEGGI